MLCISYKLVRPGCCGLSEAAVTVCKTAVFGTVVGDSDSDLVGLCGKWLYTIAKWTR